ncbi:MAG: bifunctional transcriptional activator/DNA repair enzyme protein Ada, partial [Planctomycetaceae bacterium]|nr:bifunctional transcriptional activator/DNA repair enzyme protein Ada [Planctomycetaceae bacterium]
MAIQNRSRSADGKFVYAVKTTGVYCRPTCSSRVPLRKNVRFFTTSDEAERAGFRACKRCLPHETNADDDSRNLIVQACEEIERLKGSPDLTALAAKLKIAPT